MNNLKRYIDMAVRREISRYSDDSWDDPELIPFQHQIPIYRRIKERCEEILADIKKYASKKGKNRMTKTSDPAYYKNVWRNLNKIEVFLLQMASDMGSLVRFYNSKKYSGLKGYHDYLLSNSAKQKIVSNIQKISNDMVASYSNNGLSKKWPEDYWDIHRIAMPFQRLMRFFQDPKL